MNALSTEGYTDLPPGYAAAIATFLDMRAAPAPSSRPAPPGLSLRRVDEPDLASYRDIFRRVGTSWLWCSRLRMSDAALAAILNDPGVELYLPERDGAAIGILELDFRAAGDCEIAFFGLVTEAIGQGAGRWLMDCALKHSWRAGVDRVWLHNCTLDHPNALGFYLRSGFRPYARKIEIFPDPRLDGLLPRDAAPHVPIIEA